MPVQIVLTSDVPGLGQVGEVKKVKDGFARNYLLPQRLAVRASANVIKKFELQKEKIAAQRAKFLKSAEDLSAKLAKVGLVFERPVGPGGRLFGSVTAFDIATELSKQGVTVEKKSVLMDNALKSLGDHIIRVRLHSKVMVDVPVKINAIQVKETEGIPAVVEEEIVYGQEEDL